ncbi:ABC-2 type transport system permease protein [Kribbella sp. VKM Ac-2527]|uniref:ABC-2 type transport system permease protein n=1 Tax=Kribbella caucasensis TaxID=2512215 RepID=A0A4R6KIB7_9ACTN|nr:ABC transporter permease [Kribbella sp. VKM Ac-2527]TDO50830.1 ABC-2 type transport system permease protein [Kribbella sp. VKM Ac-2527]
MSVIAVERIKLFSTRSPWWCMIIAAVLTVGFAALTTGFLNAEEEQQATIFITQPGAQLSQMVMMVMAALAVTTEYRFGTIRTSFQAVPQRASLLLGKTAVVAFLAAVVGLIAAFGGWGIGNLFAANADLAINTSAEWRLIAGQGLIFALSAVIAVAVGILIRQSAGAIAILILWPLLVENLFNLIPKVGDDLSKWSPFANGSSFLNQGQDFGLAGGDAAGSSFALGPWWALLYFAGWAAALMTLALFSASKRDA